MQIMHFKPMLVNGGCRGVSSGTPFDGSSIILLPCLTVMGILQRIGLGWPR